MGVVLKSSSKDSAGAESDIEIHLVDKLENAADFPSLQPRLAQRIVFECNDLKFVSSYGAQAWALWMQSFDARQQFVFRDVPERAIDIFNLIANFLPSEHVIESFYVPYQCDSCKYETTWLARRGKDYVEAVGDKPAKINMPPTLNCQACKNQMTIGVWGSKYFRFLEHQST